MGFSDSQLLTLLVLIIISISLTFYFSVRSLLKQEAQIHEKYYIAIRDYIEQNEESIATILDIMSLDETELE